MSDGHAKKVAVPKEFLKNGKLVSHPTRFTICFLLYLHCRIGFAELQRLLGLTPGNLDSHLKKLREAGYVEVQKVFTLRGPRTAVQITPIGRQGFREHAVKLRKLLEKVE